MAAPPCRRRDPSALGVEGARRYDHRMKYLVGLLLILALAAGGAYLVAGRMAGPAIEIVQPEKFVGAATPAQFVVHSPAAELKTLTMTLEQNGKQFPVYALGDPGAELKEEAGALRVT